jgi:hypothetical protein
MAAAQVAWADPEEEEESGVRKSGALRIGLVVLLATIAAGVFALVGRADDPVFDQISSSAAPGFIDTNGDVLFTASWHDNDNRNFTHTRVEITVPAGWTLVSSSPTGCTQAGSLITCQWGTLKFGDVVKQSVRLHANTDLGPAVISSQLLVYEGPGNPGRVNHILAPDASTNVLDPAATPDQAGDCVGANDSFGTVVGSGNSETTATGPSTNGLCTPITIVERPRTNSDFCLPSITCVNDIVTTDAPAGSINNPIKLKILFKQTNSHDLIFKSAGDPFEVAQCTNVNKATPDPCWYDRKFRNQTSTWFVNWSGVDPGWTG